MNLKEIYENFNYPSANKFFIIAKKEGLDVNMDEITTFLKKQRVHQIFGEKKQIRGHITAFKPFDRMQMDLIDMSTFYHENKGFHWIFQFIDVFSRKVFCIPIKSKTTGDVYDGLKLFLDENKNIGSMTSDNESAFKSSDVQDLLNEHNIEHIMVDVGEHKSLGIIDRSIRTIKEKIYQYFKYKNTTKYIDKLDSIINGYNNSPHRGLGNLTPNEVLKDKKASEEIIEMNTTKDEDNFKKVKSTKINVGDAVRIKKVKGKFSRAYDEKYGDTTHLIVSISKNRATLDDETTVSLRRLKVVENIVDNENDELHTVKRAKKITVALKGQGIDAKNLIDEPRIRKQAKL
jgi:hypothetical protein